MATIDPKIADMQIIDALMVILNKGLPGAFPPFECNGFLPLPTGGALDTLQRDELREVFKVFNLTTIPETMPFIEGITLFKVPLEFFAKMAQKSEMYSAALFYAIDSIRYVYCESNPGEAYKKESELMSLPDIMYVRNHHTQSKHRLDKLKLVFEKWSGETATWFMFMLSVTSQVVSKGLYELLHYDPNSRNSNMQLKALEAADAVFYEALNTAIHGHDASKITRLDVFLETRWEDKRALRGSIVWSSLIAMFETDRAAAERVIIHKEHLSTVVLKINDPIHLDSTQASNVSCLLSLIPLLKEGTGDVIGEQVTGLLDQFDREVLRSFPGGIKTPGDFREQRASVGGLPKADRFHIPNFKKPATVLSGVKVRRTTSNTEDKEKDWPLGHKDVPKSSNSTDKKKWPKGGNQKDSKAVSFAEKSAGNNPKSNLQTQNEKGTRKPGIRVEAHIYALCSKEEKKQLRDGTKPDSVVKHEKETKEGSDAGKNAKKDKSSKVGQPVSEPNKGKKRKSENKKKKKDVGSKRSKQSAAVRKVKAAPNSEEKDNNDFT